MTAWELTGDLKGWRCKAHEDAKPIVHRWGALCPRCKNYARLYEPHDTSSPRHPAHGDARLVQGHAHVLEWDAGDLAA